jgi:phosphatidylserine decarboxylase
MGRFLLGSTVVMLFPAAPAGGAGLAFNPAWAPGLPIQLGQVMATRA